MNIFTSISHFSNIEFKVVKCTYYENGDRCAMAKQRRRATEIAAVATGDFGGGFMVTSNFGDSFETAIGTNYGIGFCEGKIKARVKMRRLNERLGFYVDKE